MSSSYRSELNRDVPVASPGEFAPLRVGPLAIDPPVVLAPMAGVTNAPFRRICRRFGAGLYVSEMITARGLVEGNRKTAHLASFAPDEVPRSIQLYGTDPKIVGEAARLLAGEGRVDHIDLNFGCPVRKVTSHGGGAALPCRPRLLGQIIGSVVRAAAPVPVTVKFRKGIDDDHLTHLRTGQVAESEGAAAVGLHARTAAQLYDGHADWNAIAELKQAVTSIPVLGNGDVYEAFDALRMMRGTGCDGVIIGRGCLGRPWLFRDLADAFAGREPQDPPALGEVAAVALEHARLLCEFFGEFLGVRHMRRHGSWYTKGFRCSTRFRERLVKCETLAELEALFGAVDAGEAFPPESMRVRRCKGSGTQTVALPQGYLDGDPDDDTVPAAAAADELGAAMDGG